MDISCRCTVIKVDLQKLSHSYKIWIKQFKNLMGVLDLTYHRLLCGYNSVTLMICVVKKHCGYILTQWLIQHEVF